MSALPREQAEAIVDAHGSIDCFGNSRPDEPYCTCRPNDKPFCPNCEQLVVAIASALAAKDVALAEQERQLAECYRWFGADPRLAPYAVAEVKRLREESNAALNAAEADLAALRKAQEHAATNVRLTVGTMLKCTNPNLCTYCERSAERLFVALTPPARQPAHDSECETELTSHGYTLCRCDERAAKARTEGQP